jgi:hypothetical protein
VRGSGSRLTGVSSRVGVASVGVGVRGRRGRGRVRSRSLRRGGRHTGLRESGKGLTPVRCQVTGQPVLRHPSGRPTDRAHGGPDTLSGVCRCRHGVWVPPAGPRRGGT